MNLTAYERHVIATYERELNTTPKAPPGVRIAVIVGLACAGWALLIGGVWLVLRVLGVTS